MKKVLMLTAMAVCFGVPAAFAQEGADMHAKGEQMLDKKFAKDDLNSDGMISKEEFLKAAEERFTKMDPDGDGNVTKEELKAHHAQKRTKMMEMKEKHGAAQPE